MGGCAMNLIRSVVNMRMRVVLLLFLDTAVHQRFLPPKRIQYYINNVSSIPRPDVDPHLNYLHRVTTRPEASYDELYVLAFDHRKQFFDMAMECGASEDRISKLKKLILSAAIDTVKSRGVEKNAGILSDDTYGQDTLNEITGNDWWIGRPVEIPSSRPIELEGGRSIGSRLVSWPKEHVVKCLVFYHPNDAIDMLLQQERQVKELYEACAISGNEFLLEIIPPKGSVVDENTIADSLARFYNLNIYPDWWKLPQLKPAEWEKVTALIESRAPHCRGVLMLGLDTELECLKQGFKDSANYPICKGFAVGRTIFSRPSRRWLSNEITDEELMKEVSDNYSQLISYWQEQKVS